MNRIEKRIDFLYALKRQKLNSILQKYELTYDEYQIIKIIHYMDGIASEMIEKESKLDVMLIKNIKDTLLQKDFINIIDNKVFLGDKAKEVYPKIRKDLKKEERRITKDINKEDVIIILEALDQLIDYYEK
ncbi:MAG: hypothetical protein HFF36_01845 [Coprobacillus sp.]|nr:hypothetical protein [Coprobacillus sp.]